MTRYHEARHPNQAMNKECGDCSLCCKLPRIDELNKPVNTWCKNCDPGNGCKIWDIRPNVCKEFLCMWMSSPHMPERYKPNKIKMYVTGTNHPEILQVMVDPNFPTAYKQGAGKELVDTFLTKGMHVLIVCGEQRRFIKADNKNIPPHIQKVLKERFDFES